GEPLLQADLALAKSVLDPQCVVHNVYGSTESALFIDRCAGPGTPAPAVDVGPTVPMGHIYPLFSYAIQPLEPDDEARGTGELVIGSAFHALGDYRAGRVDAGRFTSCAGHDATGRVYRTGDIVRRLPDGRLVHLGRTGRMLKIRGQRVFLDEVEHHLRAMPGVTAAVVVARPERDGPVLYGFVCRGGRTGPEPAALEWLAARLPLFMRPRNVMAVAQMPLLAGGKVDHHALLAQVTSPTARPGPVAAGSSESARLAALWDGVLWEGAHRHEADFAALGGDSLKLMTLALQVERQFGLAFPMDPFLAEGTFARLAALLDMEGVLPAGPVAPPKTPEVLNIHRVWPARQTSAGIALAMPGWGGKAVVTPFGQGGLFPDHELWAADFPLRGGTMGVDHRWWRAAQQIVQKINAGEWEPPQLIFGYSFGGSLAWLVGRLLAGSPHCPQRVIMVDAAPLHRLPAFQHPACQHALAAVADRPPPPVLHLHRAHLPKLGLCDGWHQNLWDPADQLQCQFGLPTIDHAEMVHPQVLALAAETVSRFIAGRDMPRTSSGAMARPVLPGVLLHDALRGDPVSPRSTVQGAVDFATHAGSIDYCLALLHLHGESSTARELHEMIRAAVDATPASRMLQYIKRRLHRSHAMLCPQDLPRALPFEIGAIERTLALRLSKDSPQALPKPRSRLARQLGLAQDIAAAAAAAGWARMRRTLRQWRGS
ncbi:MAG: hypothetical protein RLZ83_1012, partial [Pseudomonadota bacterium]